MSSILDTLKSEHEQLRELFARITKTADSEADARHDLLKQIETLLIPHAKWEETVFYPAFEDRADHEQKLIYAEAIQEHRAVEMTRPRLRRDHEPFERRARTGIGARHGRGERVV